MHEEDFGTIKQICVSEIPAMRSKIDKIFDRLEGTNGNGIVTRMAMVEQRVKDVPTQKKAMVWGALWGGISGAVTIGLFLGIKAIAGS